MIRSEIPSWVRTRTRVLVALLIGSVATLTLLIAAYHRWPHDWTLVVLKDWQDLLAGFVAILAAGVAAAFAIDQMRQTERLEQTRLGRLARAERAMIPMIMSRICDYAEESAGGLAGVWMMLAAGAEDQAAEIVAPVIANEDLIAVKSMVLAAEADEASAYVELLSELQIHNARWRGLAREIRNGDAGDPFWIEQLVVDAAEIYARASNLIGATRPTSEERDLSASTRRGALGVLVPLVEMTEAIKLAEAFDQSQPLPAPRVFGRDAG